MAEEVSYTMTLNDLLTPKVQNAEAHVHKFEGALGKLGERAVRVAETMGVAFSIYKFEEFVHKGIELVHEFHIAEGQLENTIKNVGERAGMSSEQLVNMAEKLQHEIPYTTAQIVDMENALSRFENMTPAVYQRVLTMSTDIASALKRNGVEVAETLGRIMEAPAENGRLLRQLNITLTVEQRKYLMMLERTGHVAKAQEFIFKELATKGYEGAAKAAANTDPLFRYNKAMYELQMQVGKTGIEIERAFAPALENATGYLKTAAEWISNNKDLVLGLTEAVAGAAIAYGAYLAVIKGVAAYQFIVNTYQAVSNTLSEIQIGFDIARAEGLGVVTAAQWALNVAMDANPIGAVIAGVGILVGLLATAFGFWHGMFGSKGKVEIEHKYGLDTENGQYKLQEFGDNVGDASSQAGRFADTMVSGSKKVAEQEANVKTTALNFADFANSKGKAVVAALGNFEDKVVAQKKAEDELYAKEVAFLNKHGYITDADIRNIEGKSTMSKMGKKKGGLQGMQGDFGAHTGETSKATGSRITTVNIHIGSLIKDFRITPATLKEGLTKAKAMVTEALLSAVNDSQLVPDS